MKLAIVGLIVVMMALSGACMASVDNKGTSKVTAVFECPTTFTVTPDVNSPIHFVTATPGQTVYSNPSWPVAATISCCGEGWSIVATTDSGTAPVKGKMTQDDKTQLGSGFLLDSNKNTYGYLDMSWYPSGVVVNSDTKGADAVVTNLNFGQAFSINDVPGNYWIYVVLTATTSW